MKLWHKWQGQVHAWQQFLEQGIYLTGRAGGQTGAGMPNLAMLDQAPAGRLSLYPS